MMHSTRNPPKAIVLVAVGTTYPTALEPILAILRDTEASFQNVAVRLAFTSTVIRRTWHTRADDARYRSEHPAIPERIYTVQNVRDTLADLHRDGFRQVVVQSILIAEGTEYRDLLALKVELPFEKIGIGKPLLGTTGCRQPLEALVLALKSDIDAARASGAALVYMGHGNEHQTLSVYNELEVLLRRTYGIAVCIGLMKGQPDFATVQQKLVAAKTRHVLLKPLMYVAGSHAQYDMAGNTAASWLAKLEQTGYQVTAVVEGLGQNPAVRAIYLDLLKQAAQEAEIPW